ncbi:hypothetical protein WA026_012670 [Henosepilachna vigintioctopunctata]|uniref:Uncharacterized protein n=1 Tax=Henosepilachna vigintioctopunctata TaxID=420089 RepID=A0AAW1U5Z3_9CUCU
MKVAIDYVNSPEFNNMEIIKMEIQYISKEKILLEKLLSEMEYTISSLRSSLFDDEVGKQSEPGDTRADKDDNIPGISMLNKFHVESPKKSKSSKIIASTVTDDPTVSSKAGSNASYAQTTATGYQSKENKIKAHDPLSPSVICVAEHWCNPSSLPLAVIHGYTQAAAFCRTSSIHGGTLIFVKDDLEFKIVEIADLCVERHCEFCAVKLKLNSL